VNFDSITAPEFQSGIFIGIYPDFRQPESHKMTAQPVAKSSARSGLMKKNGAWAAKA
jgi:hypothetical protein